VTLHLGGGSGAPRAGAAPALPGRRSGAGGWRAGAAVAVLGMWVWVTGEVAGWLARGRWPAVGLAAVPGIAGRLPGAWPDVRRAWPLPVRAGLPPSAGMLAVGTLTAVAFTCAVVAGWCCRARRPAGLMAKVRSAGSLLPAPGSGGVGRDAGARWATGRDLRSVQVRTGEPGRLVIGRAGRRLVATEARHSLLVVGPTQSGKTTGLAIPSILEWEGPVVATSVKDDLAAATLEWRSAQGRAWVFDPTATSGLRALAGWSPLAESRTWGGAQRMASWLVEAAPARSGMSDGAFWFSAAAKLLAPLLLAATVAGVTMADIVRWNDSGDYDKPLNVLYDAEETQALVALQACAARDERIRSSVATTLETVLTPFADPAVAAATAVTDIDVAALVNGTDTLYLCGPSHEQFRVQGLFAGLVASVVAGAVDEVHRRGRPLDPPLLLVLDEAANIAPLRDLDTLASTAAGLGIQLVTVCQDLAQLSTRYGQERARTIANNHRAKLVLSGVSDLGTLDLISGLAGETAVREYSESADLRDGRRTRTSSTAYRRLAPTDALRRVPPGRGILVYGHLPAIRLSLRPWYRDPRLRLRVEGRAK
jgi:type IV secretion system protein VirD4